MSFKIIEKRIIGKKEDQSLCEDRLVITEGWVCIIDGATSKSDYSFNDKKLGRIAGEIIEKVICSVPQETGIYELISHINKEFQFFYESEGIAKHVKENPVDRLSASLVLYNDFKKEVWMIGDCKALTNNENYHNSKYIDAVLSETRALFIEMELLKGKSTQQLIENDTGRSYILELLKKQHIFQNQHFDSKYSYSVLDGFKIDKENIGVIKLKEKSVVLASDGYPVLAQTLKESEFQLSEILRTDPLCFNHFKSTKGLQKGQLSFDDRAYIRIEID